MPDLSTCNASVNSKCAQRVGYTKTPCWGWPAINACRSFRNTMFTEIGNIMITRSLLLWSVNDFDDGCFFLLFSLDLNPTEHINWQITRLRMGCQESIMILSLAVFSAFIVFKSFPQQNHSSYFILLHFQTFFMVLNVFLHLTHIYMLILLNLNSLEMTDNWSTRYFLSVIFIVLSFKKPLYAGGGGNTLGIPGRGCAAGTLEPLTYTRAGSA